MKFGKLADGRLHLCPQSGADGQGRLHSNLPKYYETAADRDGWMEVVEMDRPQGDCAPAYAVENGRIVQRWEAVDPQPDDDPILARLEFLEDCLLEMSEVVYGD